MRCISGNAADRPMVLYHAVSSYQLLEVMLHRRAFHPKAKAVLLLPDFITAKYPRYKKLVPAFFDEVYLFPYLKIPHRGEPLVMQDAVRAYEQLVPYSLSDFQLIYIAGAHFYFSLCLIQRRIPFIFFEDAAGMLSRAGVLYDALQNRFPVHAAIARKHGLFDGSNPLVKQIICLKSAQDRDVSSPRYQNFSVEEALEKMPPRQRQRLIRFFIRRRIRAEADAILLTQHFANLGIMSREEQQCLYTGLRDGSLQGLRLIIKPHPDDTLDYRGIFPDAYVIREIFPAELLPYIFRRKPGTVCALDSTGCENLRGHFRIIQLGRDHYADLTRFHPQQ